MKLLESIMVLSENGMSLVPEGTNITIFEKDLSDYTEDDLEPEDDSKSTKELSKMVQGWLAKAKPKYEAAGIKKQTWDSIVDEVLQLIKLLEYGDKEGISDRSIALKSSPLNDKIVNKVVSDLYGQVSQHLGSFEIMGSRILGDDCNKLFDAIVESVSGSLDTILG